MSCEPVEVWSLVFLAAKPDAMCVCDVSFYTDRPGAARFVIVPQNFGFKQEFVVPKDAVEREEREMGTS